MLKAFEQVVSHTLDELEAEHVIDAEHDNENYDELAELVRGRIGNFHEWKSTKRRLRGVGTHFGDVASFNQYRSIQTALARSGPNHTDEVRSILMEHFPSDHNRSVIENNLFHQDNWSPID